MPNVTNSLRSSFLSLTKAFPLSGARSPAASWALSKAEAKSSPMPPGTPLGIEAKKVMDAGGLVSDGIIIGLVKERIMLAPFVQEGKILPRTHSQISANIDDFVLLFEGQKLIACAGLKPYKKGAVGEIYSLAVDRQEAGLYDACTGSEIRSGRIHCPLEKRRSP